MSTPSSPGFSTSDRRTSLTAALLCDVRWEYGAADGSRPWGTMQLVPFSPGDAGDEPRGRIVGFDHPNERLWAVADDQLLFLNDEGRPTTVFTELLQRDGDTVLLGRHRLPGGAVHQLRALPAGRRDPGRVVAAEAPLAVRRDRGGDASVLLVRFNSLANPAPLVGPFRCEYHRIAESLAVDSLHLAEGDGEPSWFLRDRARIEAILRRECAGRRLVVLVGNSSGGYAALRFGEWLHRERIAPRVRTVSVNPQTVHGPAHRRYLLSRDWTALLPALIDEVVLDELAPDGADLPVLFDSPGKRPAWLSGKRHLVFFDSENPAECYHAARFAGQRSVTFRPVPMGRAHAWGIYEIERSGAVRRALRHAVRLPGRRDPFGRAWWRAWWRA